MKIIYYKENGKNIVKEWLKSLRDLQGRKAIDRTILRLECGNLGDEIILLLCGGSKDTQEKDINKGE